MKEPDYSQLLADIEKLREILTDEYNKPEGMRDNDMVLELSRKLDKLITKHYLK